MTQPVCYSYTRFSSPQQSKGNSLERQIKLAEEYAKKHNFTLDNTLRMHDAGLSAFSGEHIEKGALGKFLTLVNSGKIQKGSVLIVESLDRLSRDQITDALTLFMDIIKSGIKIVTLSDSMEYTVDSINNNWAQIVVSLAIMSRAHDESLTKSKRLSSSWEAKRNKAKEAVILTKICPAWIRVIKQNKLRSFEVISDRADLIREIFSMYLSGKGVHTIVTKINKDGIPAWGKSKTGWHRSYIQKILHNRAVIGDFQPKKKVDGKFVPVGEMLRNYFPQIISEEDFFRVQQKMQKNTKYPGRTGKISNLFTGLLVCSYCGSQYTYRDKGNNWMYLHCSNSVDGKGCRATSVNYYIFEKAFLEFCSALDVNKLIDGNNDQIEINSLRTKIEFITSKIENNNRRHRNLKQAISEADDKKIRKELLDDLTRIKDETLILQNEADETEIKIRELNAYKNYFKERINDINKLYSHMDALQEADRIEFRLKIRGKLRDLIKVIGISSDEYSDEFIKEFKSYFASKEIVFKDDFYELMKSKNFSNVRIEFINGSLLEFNIDKRTQKAKKIIDFQKEQAKYISYGNGNACLVNDLLTNEELFIAEDEMPLIYLRKGSMSQSYSECLKCIHNLASSDGIKCPSVKVHKIIDYKKFIEDRTKSINSFFKIELKSEAIEACPQFQEK
ncbi:recombinase family protein [Desulforegula conservatrix]|uniref:recombinase family protein n=1 Tax=Desulforegula conservatrix TaxID=153026 RepID=UPI0003FE6157|nr:recombinase family protein [Desulforegula conservatrix]